MALKKSSKISKLPVTISIVLVFSIIVNISLMRQIYIMGQRSMDQGSVVKSVTDTVTGKVVGLVEIKPALADDLYPMFLCPCCGKPIDAACCGMAIERKTYVDGLTTGNMSEEDAIAAYVKRFGLASFVDKDKQEEYRQELIKSAPTDRPIISIEPESYDFGSISQAGGVANTFFKIKNSGASELIIDRLETSCGCTSASIIYQNQEGPIFSMSGHGINEEITDWSVSIPPGGIAQLKVYYDPNVHQSFRGTAIREIYVYSNDPIDFEASASIELEQVD